MISITWILISAFFLIFGWGCNQAPQTVDISEIKIVGSVEPSDQLSYKMEPFELPEHTGAIEVRYTFTGKGKNEIEIGLYDPDGFRGSSRFSKDHFYVGKYSATPSYFSGKLSSGNWNVLLSFPTIRESSDYTITIKIIPENHPEFTGASTKSITQEKRWYAGDFHTHTGHSDGFGCKDSEGKRAPCQVFQVAEAAYSKGLDFVAIADHNTASHYQDIRTLQPIYPDLLLLRGQELTTFFGHANVFGSGVPVDFKIGYENHQIVDVQNRLKESGALLSINHPGRESGASCTGCGWTEESTDFSKLEAIEVVNGTNIENEISGIPFWENLLNQGHRIIGIGGSDDHGAGTGGDQPGIPTTMVFADELSEAEILEGVRKGNVYIKTKGSESPDIEFFATSGEQKWEMGSVILLDELADEKLRLTLRINEKKPTNIELIYNGETTKIPVAETKKEDGFRIWEYDLEIIKKGWIRVNLRDEDGTIVVISNPVFLK